MYEQSAPSSPNLTPGEVIIVNNQPIVITTQPTATQPTATQPTAEVKAEEIECNNYGTLIPWYSNDNWRADYTSTWAPVAQAIFNSQCCQSTLIDSIIQYALAEPILVMQQDNAGSVNSDNVGSDFESLGQTNHRSCAKKIVKLSSHCFMISCVCAGGTICAMGIIALITGASYVVGAATLPLSKACLTGKCGSGCTCCGCQKELYSTIFHALHKKHGLYKYPSSCIATTSAGACCAGSTAITVSTGCCIISGGCD